MRHLHWQCQLLLRPEFIMPSYVPNISYLHGVVNSINVMSCFVKNVLTKPQ